MGSLSFLRSEIRRERDRERRSVVVPEWAVVHSEVSCSDWLLVSLAALWDLNIFLQKSFLPKRAPGICSSLIHRYRCTQSMHIFNLYITKCVLYLCVYFFAEDGLASSFSSLFLVVLSFSALSRRALRATRRKTFPWDSFINWTSWRMSQYRPWFECV